MCIFGVDFSLIFLYTISFVSVASQKSFSTILLFLSLHSRIFRLFFSSFFSLCECNCFFSNGCACCACHEHRACMHIHIWNGGHVFIIIYELYMQYMQRTEKHPPKCRKKREKSAIHNNIELNMGKRMLVKMK